jgi:predicted nucleic acid-binding protein
MITAVDTNILIDIFGQDAKFGQDSAEALRQCINEGVIYACEIVWVETASVFAEKAKYLAAMQILGIEYSVITQSTALLAADIWRKYRNSGGTRQRVAADFLIGAHASHQADRFLTRDQGFYRNYFKSLKIIDPAS